MANTISGQAQAVWPALRSITIDRAQQGKQSVKRKCQRAVEHLAAVGVWCAAELSLGMDLWLSWRDVPCQGLTEAEYNALLTALRAFPDLERVARDRIGMPGPRQLTLLEASGSVRAARAAHAQGRPELPGDREAPRDLRVGDCGWPRQHPWQYEPGLPDNVTVDCTSDAPVQLDAPPNWILLQRNGRLLIRNPVGITCQLEAAQAGMLELINQGLTQTAFLEALLATCVLQQHQDNVRAIHWSRHLLACVAGITGARGLIGCRAVTFHPHYWWYSSPEEEDALGSLRNWPVDECVLILDAYLPKDREAVLRRAFGHWAHVWILRLVERGESAQAKSKA